MTVMEIEQVVVEDKPSADQEVQHALCGTEYPREGAPWLVYVGICGQDSIWPGPDTPLCVECERLMKEAPVCPRCGEVC